MKRPLSMCSKTVAESCCFGLSLSERCVFPYSKARAFHCKQVHQGRFFVLFLDSQIPFWQRCVSAFGPVLLVKGIRKRPLYQYRYSPWAMSSRGR
ncbi:hypothetical protein D3C73_1325730 [compost metagenome]